MRQNIESNGEIQTRLLHSGAICKYQTRSSFIFVHYSPTAAKKPDREHVNVDQSQMTTKNKAPNTTTSDLH